MWDILFREISNLTGPVIAFLIIFTLKKVLKLEKIVNELVINQKWIIKILESHFLNDDDNPQH